MLAKNVLQCNDMAKPFGKVVRDFLGLESTRENMEEIFKGGDSRLKNYDDLVRIPAEEKIHICIQDIQKAGIVFLNLTRDGCFQQDLFDAVDRTRSAKVMQAMDQINQKMGSQTLKYMSTGISFDKPWESASQKQFEMRKES
jgi:hypothetical protein